MSNTNQKVKDPLFHVVKRIGMPVWQSWLIRIVAVIFALILCGLITFLLTGENPLQVYVTIINGAIGTDRKIWGLAQNTALLLCVALAITPAFKMKFWNIGAEGQVLIGGLGSVYCMMKLGNNLPNWLLLIVMIVVSIICGAVWAVIPAVFKAKWNTNETLFTLMMNYVAIQLISYFTLVNSTPKGSGTIGVINSSTRLGWLPYLFDNKYLLNIIIVLVLTVLTYVYLKYNKHGYELSVVGESENTARYIGINVKKVIIRTMILSGAMCGIAGFLLVSGTNHTIARESAGGRGFTAIMVSWLAKFNPFYMIITSLLIVFLEKGAYEISVKFGLNHSFSDIITGIIIFFIIGSEFFVNYKIKFKEKETV